LSGHSSKANKILVVSCAETAIFWYPFDHTIKPMKFLAAVTTLMATSGVAQAFWQYSAPQTGLGPSASVRSSNRAMGDLEFSCNMIRYQSGAQECL